MQSIESFLRSFKEIMEEQARVACTDGLGCSLLEVIADTIQDPGDPTIYQIAGSIACRPNCPYMSLPSERHNLMQLASQLALQQSETNAEVTYYEFE